MTWMDWGLQTRGRWKEWALISGQGSLGHGAEAGPGSEGKMRAWLGMLSKCLTCIYSHFTSQ